MSVNALSLCFHNQGEVWAADVGENATHLFHAQTFFSADLNISSTLSICPNFTWKTFLAKIIDEPP
jgi:hypothetical protein